MSRPLPRSKNDEEETRHSQPENLLPSFPHPRSSDLSLPPPVSSTPTRTAVESDASLLTPLATGLSLVAMTVAHDCGTSLSDDAPLHGTFAKVYPKPNDPCSLDRLVPYQKLLAFRSHRERSYHPHRPTPNAELCQDLCRSHLQIRFRSSSSSSTATSTASFLYATAAAATSMPANLTPVRLSPDSPFGTRTSIRCSYASQHHLPSASSLKTVVCMQKEITSPRSVPIPPLDPLEC